MLACAGALLVLPWTSTRAEDRTRDEFWPEVDVFWRLDPRYRLFFLLAPSISRPESFAEAQFGVHIEAGVLPFGRKRRAKSYDEDVMRYLRVRAGVRYSGNLPWSESESEEWRGIFEVTPRYFPFEQILLALRNRIDLRWLSGDFSMRYRVRLTAERETQVTSSFSMVPYASAEAFYDTRYDTWNRARYQMGVAFPVTRALVLDSYYCRQNDTESDPAHVDALGLALNLYF